MLYTSKQVIEIYGSWYQIRKAVKEKKLFVVSHNIYSDRLPIRDEALISKEHPGAIFTLNSAFFLYDLTDVIPDSFFVATPVGYTYLKEKDIQQGFQKKEVFALGDSTMDSPNGVIRIYDRERLLIELIRFQKRFSFDYYKEVIGNYRKNSPSLDPSKIADYCSHFKYGKSILIQIMKEVF